MTQQTTLACAIVTLALAGCGGRAETKFPFEGGASKPAYVDRSIVFEGRTRSWHVKVPAAAREGRPLPLLVALHGGGGTGERLQTLAGFDAVAEREGFFVAYPEGVDHHWNDGRADTRSSAAREDVPDVAFIGAMLDELSKIYRVDPDRVYVAGISNGGMMALRLACEMSERFAGVAAVAAAMPRSLQPLCAPTRPVSAFVIAGTADTIVPYEGGEVRLPLPGARARGMVISVEATVSEWQRHDGCEGAAAERELPDTDPSDGSTVRELLWSSCREGTAVQLDRVQGGGHTWPGGWQYLDPSLVGTTNRDLDAREAIWRFFTAHPRRK